MPLPHDPGHDFLLRKLGNLIEMSAEERASVSALPITGVEVAADQDVVREGDTSVTVCLLLNGFACRYQMLDAHRRQIFSFHMPGDILDLQGFNIGTMDHSVATITRARVAYIPHADLQELINEHPRLEKAFWRDTLADAAVFREWMSGMGKRDAPTRIAHLFCEVLTRLDAIGQAPGHSAHFPITQNEIADSLGVTPVHVNRSVALLRDEGLIELKASKLTALDWDRLVVRGEFNGAYLSPKSIKTVAVDSLSLV